MTRNRWVFGNRRVFGSTACEPLHDRQPTPGLTNSVLRQTMRVLHTVFRTDRRRRPCCVGPIGRSMFSASQLPQHSLHLACVTDPGMRSDKALNRIRSQSDYAQRVQDGRDSCQCFQDKLRLRHLLQHHRASLWRSTQIKVLVDI